MVVIVLAAACSRAGDESRARRAPVAPPPPTVELPAALHVPVQVAGRAAAPITSERLAQLAPDYADSERRAWRLSRVLGAAFARPGAVVEAVGSTGVAMVLPYPSSADAPQPVLGLTRRGEVIAAIVAPQDPFPDYHGRGGRLRRPGDPLPRVMPVKHLRVYHRSEVPAAPRSEPAEAQVQRGLAALAALRIEIDGRATGPLDASALRSAPVLGVTGDSGEPRVVWRLRELAALAAGPDVRVARVVGEGGQVAELDEVAWRDGGRTPVLRVNRDGLLKFCWLGADGQVAGGEQVRSVRQLLLVH